MKVAVICPHKKHDAMASLVIEGLYDLKIEIAASDEGNGIKPEDVKGDDEFVEYAKKADYIFVLWGKGPDDRWDRSSHMRHPKYHLLDKINRPKLTVFVDGSEWTSTGHPESYEGMVETPYSRGRKIPLQAKEAKENPEKYRGKPWINSEIRKKCQWYFKRECYPEDTLQGIIPLPFGCSKSYVGNKDYWHKEKPIDIFCSFGQAYTGLRHEVEEICKKLSSEGYNVSMISNSKVSHEEYLKTISMSKITVSAWGGGNCCMREWEAMANGSCCFAQRTQILFPNRPEDGFHYVEYSSPEEFESKIRKYLKNEELCREIGKRGQQFTSSLHTASARVIYMLQIISIEEKASIWYDLESN